MCLVAQVDARAPRNACLCDAGWGEHAVNGLLAFLLKEGLGILVHSVTSHVHKELGLFWVACCVKAIKGAVDNKAALVPLLLGGQAEDAVLHFLCSDALPKARLLVRWENSKGSSTKGGLQGGEDVRPPRVALVLAHGPEHARGRHGVVVQHVPLLEVLESLGIGAAGLLITLGRARVFGPSLDFVMQQRKLSLWELGREGPEAVLVPENEDIRDACGLFLAACNLLHADFACLVGGGRFRTNAPSHLRGLVHLHAHALPEGLEKRVHVLDEHVALKLSVGERGRQEETNGGLSCPELVDCAVWHQVPSQDVLDCVCGALNRVEASRCGQLQPLAPFRALKSWLVPEVFERGRAWHLGCLVALFCLGCG